MRIAAFASALAAVLPATAMGEVEILEAGEGIEFVDMGLDPTTGAITLVGTQDGVAKVFYLSEERMSLTSAVLVGLG